MGTSPTKEAAGYRTSRNLRLTRPGQRRAGCWVAHWAIERDPLLNFKDVAVAEAEGYQLLFCCVGGPESGAMGLHDVNLSLIGDAVLDPAHLFESPMVPRRMGSRGAASNDCLI